MLLFAVSVNFELVITCEHTPLEGFEHLAAVVAASGELRHRDGVRQRGVELRLVDIDADSEQRARQHLSRTVVFDQHAFEFAVPGVDVVGPLDAGVDAVMGEGVGQRQRQGLAEQELLPRAGRNRGSTTIVKVRFSPSGAEPLCPRCPRPAVWCSAQTISPWRYFASRASSFVEVVVSRWWIIFPGEFSEGGRAGERENKAGEGDRCRQPPSRCCVKAPLAPGLYRDAEVAQGVVQRGFLVGGLPCAVR